MFCFFLVCAHKPKQVDYADASGEPTGVEVTSTGGTVPKEAFGGPTAPGRILAYIVLTDTEWGFYSVLVHLSGSLASPV